MKIYRLRFPILVIAFSLLFAFEGVWDAKAQIISLYDVVYRPPGIKYRVLNSGAHEIIYQEGSREQAREILDVILSTTPETSFLLSTSPDIEMSLILNDFNDSGNGFVTPFPFKSEIESVALRGRGLSREHESWTQVVTTHEMVHAVQAEFNTSKSLVGVIRRFSPDFSRAINLFIPPGFTEGLAVFRESQVPEGAGRLNHPYFLMQARAGINASGGWSLSQMLETPSFTRPFDRFYKGGSLFTQFFIQTYGKAGVAGVFRWQQQMPIAGFGANLKYATGESPSRIRKRFQQWYDLQEEALIESLGPISGSTPVRSKKGEINRRPQWTSDSTWVAYSLAYDLARGFQLLSESGSRKRLTRNEISDDAVFLLDRASGKIYYSRYTEHVYTPAAKTAYSYVLDLATGREERILGSDHTYNPVPLNDGSVVALHSKGQFNSIVEIGEGVSRKSKLSFPRSDFVSMAPRPNSDSLTVIVNSAGHQAVYLIDSGMDQWKMTPWIGFPGSTIFDGSWSENGHYFTFTSDRTGILNVYVLDAWTEQIVRVTNAKYAAMEGQVSSDGKRLVYVEYADQQFDVRTSAIPGSFTERLSRDDANYTWATDWESDLNRVERQSHREDSAVDKRYRAMTRLAPRMVYPTAYLDSRRTTSADARLGFGIGLALQGTDPLQKVSYHAEGIVQKSDFWGEVGIQTGFFAFRPGLQFERRPETVDAIDLSTGERSRIIRDRTAFIVSTFLPVTIRNNVDRTSFVGALSLSFRKNRLLDDDLALIQPSSSDLSLLPAFFYGHRVLKNPRDIIPTSGQTLSWFGDFELENDFDKLRHGWALMGNVYVPLLQKHNTSIRLNAGLLRQNNPSIFGLTFFKPIGWNSAFLDDDTFLRYGLRIVQPIAFPDNGLMSVPVFLRAVYLFGFANHLHRASDTSDNVSSVGGGLGVKFRLFHFFDFNLSMTSAYRIGEGEWRFLSDVTGE